MKWIHRHYEDHWGENVKPGKILVMYGPRRVGKTSLIEKFMESFEGKAYYGSGDDLTLREVLESERIQKIKNVFAGYDLLVIDEAQRIGNVGRALKIIADYFPQTSCIATGSSSFALSQKIGEPLTGRQKVLKLFPISMTELSSQYGKMHLLERLDEYLIYGAYPEVLTADNGHQKKEYLIALRDAYLLKDILELENLRNASKLNNMLQLLAFQIGREVSLNELSNNLGIAKQTVERYLDLLEKTFVIKKVTGFSRNLRKEIQKTARYYFFDNGIRNALVNNFNDLGMRNDTGMLWENYLFMERLKKQEYSRIVSNNYFWRTYDRKEIDLVEERDGKLYGYEFKWRNKKQKPPKLWLDTYSNACYELITKDNFLDFVL